MSQADLTQDKSTVIHIWVLRLMAALLALCGFYSLYYIVTFIGLAGQFVEMMSGEEWRALALWGSNGVLFLLTAWFAIRRQRYAVWSYAVMVALWLGTLVDLGATQYLVLWQEPGFLRLLILGVLLTGLPGAYLYFLRTKNILR